MSERDPADETADDVDAPALVVALGAAEGAAEALGEFFAAVEDVHDVAFVVIRGATSTSPAPLVEMLRAVTDLEVVALAERAPLQGGRVYVAPAGARVHIEHGTLRAVAAPADESRNPIDTSFSAFAEVFAERCVGICLSGAGTDGVVGLETIACAGGLTLAQDEASAEVGVMPGHAAASGVVDRVLAAADLARAVADHAAYLRQVARAGADVQLRAQLDEVLAEICTLVAQSTGHGLHQYKSTTLHRRIERRMHVLRVPDAQAYLHLLRRDGDEAGRLLREVLIGVTAFFRDPEAFECIADTVVPALLRDRSSDDAIRIWVPGCATGEEAYSLAMLLREAVEGRADAPAVQIFASDIDERALAFARAGSYPARIAESLSRQRLERWFVRRASRWQISPQLRDMCLFASHNLVSDPPFSRLDMISCRNVLIYLGAPLQQKLVSLFHYALKPNGYLFLGPSENIVGHAELFRPVSAKHRVSQRKPTPLRTSSLLPGRRGERQAPDGATSATVERPDVHLAAQRAMLDDFTPSYVVVDEHAQILVVSGRIERFMEFGEGAFRNNLVGMLKPALRTAVRPALAEAIQSRRSVARRQVSSADTSIRITITVQPLPPLAETDDLFLVVFDEDDSTNHGESGREVLASAASEFVIEQLEHELATTRADLERSIQDLEAANEELKSSNEELLSMNEELQSANEELESAKEDVQSGNEALAQTNTDLENLLSSSDIATIFLDDELRVQRFTPSARAIYNLLPVDIGRPIEHITPLARDMSPLPRPADVAVAGVVEDELTTQDGRTFLRRVLPYETSEGQQRGIVATFTDVTALRQTVELLQDKERRLMALTDDLAEAKRAAESASRAKSEFLAQMGHEIRTPIEAMLVAAESVGARSREPADAADLDVLRHKGQHLLALVDDFLDLSKIAGGEVNPAPVATSPPGIAKAPRRGTRVLIVGAPSDARDALQSVLEVAGYEASVATGLEQARAVVHHQPPEAALIDLDVVGEAASAIAIGLREMPALAACTFIAISSRSAPVDLERSGFHHHLVKPVLLERLQRVLPRIR